MNTKITSLALATIVAAIFTGCSNKKDVAPPVIIPCTQDGVVAPNWTCSPADTLDGFYSDIGSAPYSKLGVDFTRREALASARSSLSQQIKVLVKDKVEHFSRSTGLGDKEFADKVSTHVSKQVAKVSLIGSKQTNFWQHPGNKKIFILAAVNKEVMKETILDEVESSYQEDAARWQQFQAENSLKKLEEEFEDIPILE